MRLIIQTRYEYGDAPANHKSIVSISASPGAISWEISSFLAGIQSTALSVIFIRFKLQLSQKDLVLAYVLKMAKLRLSKFTLSGLHYKQLELKLEIRVSKEPEFHLGNCKHRKQLRLELIIVITSKERGDTGFHQQAHFLAPLR